MKKRIEIAVLATLVMPAAFLMLRKQTEIVAVRRVPPPILPESLLGALSSGDIRWDKLKEAQQVEYRPFHGGRSANKVGVRNKPVVPFDRNLQVPSQPDPTPRLPLSFFGYGAVPSGSNRRAFLTDGQEVYIVVAGDTVFGRFRILRIDDASLEFEDLATGNRSTAPLEEGAAPGRTAA
jgi:hypothetical protein